MKNFIKYYFTTFLYLLVCFTSFGQTVPQGSVLLKKEEVSVLFTDSIKKQLKIIYPIYNVYSYTTKGKLHYITLAENVYKVDEKNKYSDSIQAIDVTVEFQKFKLNFSINDFKHKEGTGTYPEYSIWFWTKYFNLNDIDGDGMADAIVVYGTNGPDGKSYGRIKIITYYKNKKYIIRHQNSDMDFDRHTYVDKAFYTLPLKIQAHLKKLISKIQDDNNAIFPAGWQKAMQNKKTYWEEKFN